MATINMHEAKTQLSDLVARAEAGEDIVIARRNRPAVRLVPVRASAEGARREPRGFAEDGQSEYDPGDVVRAAAEGRAVTIVQAGKPVARIVPLEPDLKSRGWGAWEGRYRLPDSFFDPLPDEELQAWDGPDEPPA